MPRIILIETSTSQLSTALTDGDKVISYKECAEPLRQASLTAVFVKEMLDDTGLSVKDYDAVCVSKGPGSYTGLRVGSSTAKGLCFGAGIPLIAVGTMELLVNQAIDAELLPQGCRYIIPMIDARRMEVYSAVFTADGRKLSGTSPVIVDADSFRKELEEGVCLFIGDGALKCKDTIASDNAVFVQCCPRADAMLNPALEAYKEKRFENTAYFEPFYLKDFVATTSKKKLF